MRTLAAVTLAVALLCVPTPGFASADVPVERYLRKDGTPVRPHRRSPPDSSFNNNWSTDPNLNPHTGEKGPRPPRLYDDAPPSGTYDLGVPPPPRRRSR